MRTRETIEAEVEVGIFGVDWKVYAEAEVDDNEYLYPDTVQLSCLRDAEGAKYGHHDPISVVFGELPESAQSAIERALGEELRERISGADVSWEDYR